MRVHIFLFMREYLKHSVFPGYYNVLVKVNKLILLVDFIVLDMEESSLTSPLPIDECQILYIWTP
jgi:hypothetical protein